jgi:hypothetical protein
VKVRAKTVVSTGEALEEFGRAMDAIGPPTSRARAIREFGQSMDTGGDAGGAAGGSKHTPVKPVKARHIPEEVVGPMRQKLVIQGGRLKTALVVTSPRGQVQGWRAPQKTGTSQRSRLVQVLDEGRLDRQGQSQESETAVSYGQDVLSLMDTATMTKTATKMGTTAPKAKTASRTASASTTRILATTKAVQAQKVGQRVATRRPPFEDFLDYDFKRKRPSPDKPRLKPTVDSNDNKKKKRDVSKVDRIVQMWANPTWKWMR